MSQHSRRRWAKWKTWAKESVEKGGKVAHSYSKQKNSVVGPVGGHGLELQGDQAVDALRKEWDTYRQDHRSGLSASQLEQAMQAEPLGRPDLQV
eukprot:3029404-Pyramimonas_sp.AAC.1